MEKMYKLITDLEYQQLLNDKGSRLCGPFQKAGLDCGVFSPPSRV